MKEIWKAVPGYEGLYEVSNFGNVKSLKFNKERILKQGLDGHGYLQIGLCINNKRKTFKTHKLVAMAFLNHIPNGFEQVINHIDNNQLNNHVDNLELVSTRYNSSCHKNDVGVSWAAKDKRWQSHIRINSKSIFLGYFIDKQDALNAYKIALENTNLYDGDAKEFRNKCKLM